MSTSRRHIDMWNSLYLLDPTAAPLWTLINRLKSMTCKNPKIEWLFNPCKGAWNQATREVNYCQIFRKNIQVTHTLAASKLYAASDRSYVRKKKGIELLRDFEAAMVYGAPQQSQSHPIVGGTATTVGGVCHYADKHSKLKTTQLDVPERAFEGVLRQAFRYGPSSRYLFCGTAPSFIKKRARLIQVPKTKTYGVPVTQFISPHGTVNIIKDQMMGNFGVLTDVHALVLRPLSSRGAFMTTNCQNPGDDYYRDVLIAEWTLEVLQPDNIAILGTPTTAQGPPGIPQGSTFGAGSQDTLDDGEEHTESLDEILGLEDPIWRI